MATKNISLEEHYAIEDVMYEKGYLTYEYIHPEKTVETDVACPVCGENLILFSCGNSYQISCKSDSCVVMTFRGL
jgi:hypothetical protein